MGSNASKTERGSNSNIAKRWKDLSGQNSWKQMLDPLDIDLRRYIIHYGQMAQATYDAFDSDTGRSRYGERDFFSMVGLEKGNPFKYEVTKFVYATSEIDFIILNDVEETNWIGYVAVATDECKAILGRRDIVIAWRGTQEKIEWVKDVQILLDEAPLIFGLQSNVKVHQGFYSVYTADNSRSVPNNTSVRNQVLKEIKRLVNKYKDEEISITVTGHSLGAALATLNAVDIVTNGFNIPDNQIQPQKACLVTTFVFASPRVGDSDFKKFFASLKNLRALRIRNKGDIVPRHPLLYSEVGQELEIDAKESNFLKNSFGDVAGWHNLEVYLHGVAGTQGMSKGGFNLEAKRDIALVNKGMDALKDECHIPVAWWRKENKAGMVQQPDGTWKMQVRYSRI